MGPLFYYGDGAELPNAPKRGKLAQWNFEGTKPEKVELGEAITSIIASGAQVWTDSFTLGITDEASAFPVFYATGTQDEAKLLDIINSCSRRLGNSDFVDLSSAVNWILNEPGFYLHNYTVTEGQGAAMDASNPESYTPGESTWKDLSGSGNDLNLNPQVDFDTSDAGGSFVFDGQAGTGMYTAEGSNQYNIAGDITMESWIKLSPAFNNAGHIKPMIINKESSFEMAIDRATGCVDWALLTVNNAGWFWRGIPSVDIRDNKWHHVVVTRNVAGQEYAYIDGNQVVSYNGPSGNLKEALNMVNIAARGGNATLGVANLPGKIGDVKVYNKALSASEVLTNYQAGKARFNK